MENNQTTMEMEAEFEDLLPVMVEKLDVEAFVSALCGGFKLLADSEMGLITCESLVRNSALLGMDGMSKEDAESMLSPGNGMMQDAEAWLHKAIEKELNNLT
ncbi:putative calcium-binding protein KIC-like [Sesbania bispinosa]|nr:putative calcium-binding protein KIC-like [Sesbania bispinosa]